MIDGEVLGDPLDVKMFEFTRWTLEEGHVAGTGNIKNKGTIVEQTALVQTVVRPPGSSQFRLEDALKGSAKVCQLTSPFRRCSDLIVSTPIFWNLV